MKTIQTVVLGALGLGVAYVLFAPNLGAPPSAGQKLRAKDEAFVQLFNLPPESPETQALKAIAPGPNAAAIFRVTNAGDAASFQGELVGFFIEGVRAPAPPGVLGIRTLPKASVSRVFRNGAEV